MRPRDWVPALAIGIGSGLAVVCLMLVLQARGYIPSYSPRPASVAVIPVYGYGIDKPVQVPCSWVRNNPYGPYLPPDGKIPVGEDSWINAMTNCGG